MRFVDSHCHLEQDEFSMDLHEVIRRAEEKGAVMISSAITADTWSRVVEIAREYSSLYASIGLDPMISDLQDEALEAIEKYKDKLVAIGEIGIDHYRERDHDRRDQQERAFRRLIRRAQELSLPIQVHSRSAGRKAIEILSDEDAKHVHMHAFDGKSSIARSASRDLGYYFSIPTSVLRSPQKRKLTKAVAIERLLIETDSPVLGPEKGVRNEPANITIALEEVSNILRRSVDEMEEIIRENSLRLYSKL